MAFHFLHTWRMRYIILGKKSSAKSILRTTLTSGKDAAVCHWRCIVARQHLLPRPVQHPLRKLYSLTIIKNRSAILGYYQFLAIFLRVNYVLLKTAITYIIVSRWQGGEFVLISISTFYINQDILKFRTFEIYITFCPCLNMESNTF